MALKRVSPQPYKPEDGITQSMLQAFLACRQRLQYITEGWAPLSSFSGSADRGSLFHSLLEHWYKEKSPEKYDLVSTWLDNTLVLYKLSLQKSGPLPDMNEAENLAMALWEPYVNFWRKSDSKFKWESLEDIFDIQWNQNPGWGLPNYRLRGKIDGVLLLNNKRWLFETKTKVQIDDEGLSDALMFDFQNLFYLTVLDFLQRPAIGVIYNVIRTPSLRKTETDQERIERLKAEAQKDPRHYFIRYEVSYPKETIDRFRRELSAQLSDYCKFIRGEIPLYRSQPACITRMKCTFLKACSSGSMVEYKKTRKLFSELEV